MKYGLTQFIFRDIHALMKKGHKVRIFTLHCRDGLYNPLSEWEVIPISYFRIFWCQFFCFLNRPRLYLLLLKEALESKSLINLFVGVSFSDKLTDTEIIFSYFGDHKIFTAYYLKRITNIPLIVTIRAYELYRNPNPTMFLKSLDYCDRIVTITEHNKSLLVNKFGISPERIDIVRQILDLNTYKPQRKIKILIVGYFAEKKGHEILFKAIKTLNRSDIEVWVVGDKVSWVLNVDCHKIVKELGIESQVAFFGPQRNTALLALYRECDVFCLPSHPDRYGDCEGFPNVIAEAMAFGKPVISTRHAGIPEAVESILVDENSVEQLVAALVSICNSTKLRFELGQSNRQRAKELFSERNNTDLENILKKYALKPVKTSNLTTIDTDLVH